MIYTIVLMLIFASLLAFTKAAWKGMTALKHTDFTLGMEWKFQRMMDAWLAGFYTAMGLFIWKVIEWLVQHA